MAFSCIHFYTFPKYIPKGFYLMMGTQHPLDTPFYCNSYLYFWYTTFVQVVNRFNGSRLYQIFLRFPKTFNECTLWLTASVYSLTLVKQQIICSRSSQVYSLIFNLRIVSVFRFIRIFQGFPNIRYSEKETMTNLGNYRIKLPVLFYIYKLFSLPERYPHR